VVAVLYVGAASEVEMKEKKTELMMHYATRAAEYCWGVVSLY
jgi:hypothetical protein